MSLFNNAIFRSLFHVALSSAYNNSLTPLADSVISFIIIRNINGLMTLPCGVPFSRHRTLESSVLTRTCIVQSVRKSLTHLTMFPSRPSCAILNRRPSCQTRSNALFKLIITDRVYSLLLTDLCTSSARRMIWSMQRLCLRKPDWNLLNSCCSSMNQLNRADIIRSIILHNTNVNAIGR